jgi:hypothetical protein
LQFNARRETSGGLMNVETITKALCGFFDVLVAGAEKAF